MGINDQAIASYLISLYCSAAALTDDALGLLENVDLANYYDYIVIGRRLMSDS